MQCAYGGKTFLLCHSAARGDILKTKSPRFVAMLPSFNNKEFFLAAIDDRALYLPSKHK